MKSFQSILLSLLHVLGVPAQEYDFDNTFQGAKTVTYWVRAVAIQSDGKIVVGGDFRVPGANFVARLHPAGELDTSFSPNEGPSSDVRSIAFQEDGRILIGGSFSSFDGALRAGVARLHPDGTLDDSFIPELSGSTIARFVGAAPDGKIVVLNDAGLFRLFANGSKDYSFKEVLSHQWITNQNGGGTTSFNQFTSLQLLTNGKILIGGEFPALENRAWGGLVRLDSDGMVDSSFQPHLPPVDAIQLRGDGKILVSKKFETSEPFRNLHHLVVLNDGGRLKPGFDTNAVFNSEVLALAPQADGKILVGGRFTEVNGIRRAALARLNADGTFDRTFDAFSRYFANNVSQIAIQSDQKILVAGGFQGPGDLNQVYFARIAHNSSNARAQIELGEARFSVDEGVGTLSVPVWRIGPATGEATVTVTTAPSTATLEDYTPARSLLTFADGQSSHVFAIQIIDDLLIERWPDRPGELLGTPERFFIELSNPGGNVVLGSQSSMEIAIIDNDSGFEFAQPVFSVTEGGRAEILVRRLGDTRLRKTVEFATRGETATAGEDFIPGAGTIVFDAGQSTRTLWLLTTKDPSLEPVETTALELTLGADNEAASLGTLSNATLRILDDRAGAPDPQFAAQPFWRDFSASALALQSDGKVIASGAGSHPLVRFNADGSLDETFVPAPQAGSPSQLVIDQSGKLLIRGHSAPFARLTSDGAWDTGFFPAVGSADSMVPLANGKILVGTHVVSQLDESGKLEATWETRGHRMLLQPDGKIVVAAVVREDSADKLILRRLNLDGSIDASFAPDWEFSDFGGMTGWALLPDGRIMISGWFSAGFQSAHHRIVRIQSNGLLDDGFSSDLHLDVTALAVQSGGKVLAGTSSGSLIRLNSNGSRDATFDTGFGATRDNGPGSIRSIALQPDGKILVGGGFDAFNGVPARGLVRLQNDPASAAGLIEFDPPTYVVGEGSTSVVISIRRTVGSYGVVTVSYATQNGTAAAGGDFSPQTGVIIFGDGDAGNKKIEIPLVNDSVAEPSQLFRMGLANPVGGALLGAHALAEIQIIDNDLLKITRISHTNDLIAIDWIGGGTLENSEVVGPGAHWLTVGIGGSATIQSTGRSKFFRVRDAGL